MKTLFSDEHNKIIHFFSQTLSNLDIISQKTPYQFVIMIDKILIEIIFTEYCCSIEQTSSSFKSSISYELGIEKIFTAQKGIFKTLELLMKSIADKKTFGQFLSIWKQNVLLAVNHHHKFLDDQKIAQQLKRGYLDPSSCIQEIPIGYEHLLNKVQDEMLSIFRSMGYTCVEERELEDEYHNFEALNIDANHPARQDQDSFYVSETHLMRTHTSSSQIRTLETMLKKGEHPPIAIVCPGVCYRRDAVDATHFPVFRQMEGLVVDKNLSFADLKGTLLEWAKAMFGTKTQIRLRPDYFPFTEPSSELSVASPDLLEGRWIELLGCGMVHPEVFKNVGLDPDVWKGFAFGTGIERIAMMRYNIKDIRFFVENDIRFLQKSL